jgi:hypothetical protein
MKLLLLLALLASAVGVGADNAQGCSYVRCEVLMSNGMVTGYGCVTAGPNLNLGGCQATVSGCRFTPCG